MKIKLMKWDGEGYNSRTLLEYDANTNEQLPRVGERVMMLMHGSGYRVDDVVWNYGTSTPKVVTIWLKED